MGELRLGLLGLSEGNGHPYSWAAIVNGYDEEAMARCPFPAIPRYLSRHRFPEEAIADARVTHVWTQDPSISADVAAAAAIEHVVSDPGEMLGEVDAVLLARDDAERHAELAGPFLDAGLPIYVDKPLATGLAAARDLFSRQARASQLFTCSALRFAPELGLDPATLESIGPIGQVLGSSPKRWSRYAVHVIEPALALIGNAGEIRSHDAHVADGAARLRVEWDSGLRAEFATLGEVEAPIQLTVVGQRGEHVVVFEDSFAAFKAALERFVAVAKGEAEPIPEREVLRVVELIELGMDAGAT
ncbi:MAG TPA: Gfo/Idh/MocA family oxidoreductase [Solirubrobacterales bacterium]|nr:Gfo/Idh/MocA family oxidoreductase [Solirubrobacterales bacterium]